MGLMNRVLSTTGAVAGDGLLKRALELRQSAQARTQKASAVGALVLEPTTSRQVDEEKKKPSLRYWKRAA